MTLVKSTTRLFTLAAGLAAATTVAAAYLTTSYWHQVLPNRLYRKAQLALAAKGPITGGWIDQTPRAGYVANHLVASYHGGLTVLQAGQPVTYEFDIAETGAITYLARLTA